MLLDDVLPEWDFRERHAVVVDADEADLLRAVDELTWREVPVFRGLMRVRSLRRVDLAPDQRVLAGMTAGGFVVLGRSPEEIVFGIERAGVSIAGNFRYDGSALTTETRVRAIDDRSRRRFRAYWLVIRGPSGLIRREWLRAVVARAQRSV
ncbi:MAG TPA: hypothetical protein VNA12_00015 [Mycobacteriales bacterium]|nr:hypothetical protein [Mycobacteriales bacterium]